MSANSVCDIRRLDDSGWMDAPEKSGKLFVNLGQIELHSGTRYLLTVNADGSPNIKEIPMYAAIASQARYLEMMMEPNGMYVSTMALQAFVSAASALLANRQVITGEVRHPS